MDDSHSTHHAKRRIEILLELARLEMDFRSWNQSNSSLVSKVESDKESVTDSNPENGRRTKNTWQKTANMIWDKIADHRAGNAFLKLNKNRDYNKIIKKPMSLENVKQRIRSRVILSKKAIKSTSEFHRDVMQVLCNAVMYSPEDKDLYTMALDLKLYTDNEMQNFLILHPQD